MWIAEDFDAALPVDEQAAFEGDAWVHLLLGRHLLLWTLGAHVEALDVTVQYSLAVGDLPDLHRDPFDRIVAHARVEGSRS